MAYVIITDEQNKLHKIVFKNVPLESAKAICERMNALNDLAAIVSANAVKLVYKVIGK